MRGANIREIYLSGAYKNNNPSWHEEDSQWKATQINNLIRRNKISPRTICEIGCGSGEILSVLSRDYFRNSDFIGYEISPQAYEMCLPKQKERLIFEYGDLLKEKNIYYDIVMAIDVFEHVEDYYNFLRDLRRFAEYKIFHIPLDLSVQAIFRSSPIMRARMRLGHIHYFTKETALSSLNDAGYSIVDFFYTRGGVDIPTKSLKRKILKIPRKIAFSINKDIAVRVLGGYSLMVLAK